MRESDSCRFLQKVEGTFVPLCLLKRIRSGSRYSWGAAAAGDVTREEWKGSGRPSPRPERLQAGVLKAEHVFDHVQRRTDADERRQRTVGRKVAREDQFHREIAKPQFQAARGDVVAGSEAMDQLAPAGHLDAEVEPFLDADALIDSLDIKEGAGQH